MQKPTLIRLWQKIINPTGTTYILKQEFTDFLERLARGKISVEPLLVSEDFARKMMQLFEHLRCFEPASELVNLTKIKQLLDDEVVDVYLFVSAAHYSRDLIRSGGAPSNQSLFERFVEQNLQTE